jgi:hypothetical protein
MMPRNAEPPPQKNEPPGSFSLLHSQGTQKNTHTLFFGKIHRKTETPRLEPYSFPPSPFLLGIRIFYYRILNFLAISLKT